MMTMMKTIPALFLLTGVLAPAVAAPPVPGFRQLEATYVGGGGVDGVKAALSTALPRGMSIVRARQKLEDAGADCKRERHDHEMFECLIHQYSFADRAADDVRWTIKLGAPSGLITTLNVDRYVDQHGT